MTTPSPSVRGPLRIHAVAELTGVPAATLRAWERRYGIPTPERTASAYRLYGPRDVERVRAMRELCDQGMSASEAARVVLASPLPATGEGEASAPRDPWEAARGDVLAALAAFDLEGVERAVARASMLGSAQSIYEHVLSPLLVTVGEEWCNGTLSVAQEHLFSETIETTLRALLRLLQPAGPTRSVLLACFADEEHVLGLLGAALGFAAWGYRVTLLGARTPPFALSDAVAALRPDLVGLGVTIPPVPARARALVREYEGAMHGTPWVVGGRGAAAIKGVVEAHGGFVAEGEAAGWQKLARTWTKSGKAARKQRRRVPPLSGGHER